MGFKNKVGKVFVWLHVLLFWTLYRTKSWMDRWTVEMMMMMMMMMMIMKLFDVLAFWGSSVVPSIQRSFLIGREIKPPRFYQTTNTGHQTKLKEGDVTLLNKVDDRTPIHYSCRCKNVRLTKANALLYVLRDNLFINEGYFEDNFETLLISEH